jgi:hypothetical protein
VGSQLDNVTLGIVAGCCIAWKVKHLAELPASPWRYRSALAGLVLIAMGSVLAGVIATSPVFWSAAGVVFLTSTRPLIAYLRRQLDLPRRRRRHHYERW